LWTTQLETCGPKGPQKREISIGVKPLDQALGRRKEEGGRRREEEEEGEEEEERFMVTH